MAGTGVYGGLIAKAQQCNSATVQQRNSATAQQQSAKGAKDAKKAKILPFLRGNTEHAGVQSVGCNGFPIYAHCVLALRAALAFGRCAPRRGNDERRE
jgi:hypothetical protein